VQLMVDQEADFRWSPIGGMSNSRSDFREGQLDCKTAISRRASLRIAINCSRI
jgi:hypothetical protein